MATELLNKQHDLYGRISRAMKNLKSIGVENITAAAIESRLNQLEINWSKFEDTHDELLTKKLTTTEKENAYFTEDVYAKAEEDFLTTKAEFKVMLSDLTPTPVSSLLDTSAGRSEPGYRRSLPPINLPFFSGRYQDWTTFKDMFQSIVGNNDSLTTVEKLHYLKCNLAGDALRVLAGISITEENYNRAWERLNERFENKRALVNSQLDTLFALKPLNRKSARDLETLRTTVAEVLDALGALGARTEHWDFIIVHFVCRRLDQESHEAWELSLGSATEPPTYAALNRFLESRVRALETIDGRVPPPKPTTVVPSSPAPSRTNPRYSARVHNSRSAPCPCCGAIHYIALCPQYRAKTPEQRRSLVNSKRLCFNCLGGTHQSKDCRSTKRCTACNEAHHSTLHSTSPPSRSIAAPGDQPANSSSTNGQPSTASPPSSVVHHAFSPDEGVSVAAQALLSTAIVKTVSPRGGKVYARALVDQGSELSFIDEALVRTLQLQRRQSTISLFGIGSQKHATTRGVVTLGVQLRLNESVTFSVEAHVLSKVTSKLPSQPIQPGNWKHLEGLELADPHYCMPSHVDLLLGANVYGHLLKSEIRRSGLDELVAQLTALGWIISGPTSSAHAKDSRTQGYTCVADDELHRFVHEFWAQETVESPAGGAIPEEEKMCEQHFRTTHSRNAEGRYTVRLPFKCPPPEVNDTKTIATRMLNGMQGKLQHDPVLKTRYTEFIQEYAQLGHMEKIEKPNDDAFFLPHHGVLRESSSSTKLRVVFNGSQKTSSGVSLNDCLHSGQKLLQDLVDVIMRWRRYPYVFAADIQKMYRQILVHPDDRKYQCILWRENPDEPLEYFELATVTYGLASFPFQALRVLRQLAEDEKRRFPLASRAVEENFYVDDGLSGDYSVKGAVKKVQQLDGMMSAGGFSLQKWVANEDRILSPIEEERKLSVEKTFEDRSTLRALGLKWNPGSDSFLLTFNEDDVTTASPTKRIVLSVIARLYDPLGWLAPVTVAAKIFLQVLWTRNLHWDAKLPEDLAVQWSDFTRNLNSASSISIPRWLGTMESSVLELHGFSDASRAALSATVYLRVVKEDFHAESSLLVAKTRVAPLKNVTIARLELSAAVLLTQLVTKVRQSLNLSAAPVHLWVDSAVALTWIRGHPSRWKEFVSNRVALIQELLPAAHWRHIAGSENPADAASRGLTPEQLRDHPSWWRGPGWLSLPSTSWPNSLPRLSADVNLEERPAAVLLASPSRVQWELVQKYSTLERLLRVTALVIEAASRFRHGKESHGTPLILEPRLLNQARLFWIRNTQEIYLSEDIKVLKGGAPLPRSNPLLRLTPFLDEDGLLRVGGRLQRSKLDYDCIHPYILPRQSALTT